MSGVVTPMVLYVGSQPKFGKCMEEICLSDTPDQYNVSWVQSFNLDSSLATQGRSFRDVLASLDLAELVRFGRDDYIYGNLTLKHAEYFQSTLQNLDGVVRNASDGWLLGSGSWYDPCVDRQGTINTIVVFAVFFLLVCVVVYDYLLQRRTSGEYRLGPWSLCISIPCPQNVRGQSTLPPSVASSLSL